MFRWIAAFILGAALVAAPIAAGEYKAALAYDEKSSVKLRKCFSKSFFGQKVKKCIDVGSIGGGVSGSAALQTFADEESGEIGAVMEADQNFLVILFGKKIKLGVVCTFNSGASTSYGYTFGFALSIPPVPSVSVVDILNSTQRRVVVAKTGPMAGKAKNVRSIAGKLSSGYAGAVSSPNFRKLMSAGARGCALRTNDYTLFSGIDGVDLFKVGISFDVGASKWKLVPETASASVAFNVKMTAVAKVGGQKISFSVLGEKVSWKLPGFSVKKSFTLLSQTLSI
jgi:hypothetical protein